MVDGLAELPWDREALRDGQNRAGEQIRVHQFVEGKTGMWQAAATGSNYEPMIDKVLRQLARDPALRAMGSAAPRSQSA